MFLTRQEIDDTDTVAPGDGVTVEKVKSCAGGEFASCSMPIIFGALAAAGLLGFIIWYWWRSGKNKETKAAVDAQTEAARQVDKENKETEQSLTAMLGNMMASTAVITRKLDHPKG